MAKKPGPKEKLVFREEELTGWRLNLKRFAFWSLFPIGYYIIFHYQDVYNENMEYQNVLATPRRLHDDFFRWLLGKQTMQPEKKIQTLKELMADKEKREQAAALSELRQKQGVMALLQRVENKGITRVLQEREGAGGKS